MPRFADLVEEATSLNTEELEMFKRLLEKELIERKRNEILKSGEEAKIEYKEGKLHFYYNHKDLMNSLNEQY